MGRAEIVAPDQFYEADLRAAAPRLTPEAVVPPHNFGYRIETLGATL